MLLFMSVVAHLLAGSMAGPTPFLSYAISKDHTVFTLINFIVPKRNLPCSSFFLKIEQKTCSL